MGLLLIPSPFRRGGGHVLELLHLASKHRVLVNRVLTCARGRGTMPLSLFPGLNPPPRPALRNSREDSRVIEAPLGALIRRRVQTGKERYPRMRNGGGGEVRLETRSPSRDLAPLAALLTPRWRVHWNAVCLDCCGSGLLPMVLGLAIHRKREGRARVSSSPSGILGWGALGLPSTGQPGGRGRKCKGACRPWGAVHPASVEPQSSRARGRCCVPTGKVFGTWSWDLSPALPDT